MSSDSAEIQQSPTSPSSLPPAFDAPSGSPVNPPVYQPSSPAMDTSPPRPSSSMKGVEEDLSSLSIQDGAESSADMHDRSEYNAWDIAVELWKHLGLPVGALSLLNLPNHDSDEPSLPSSFKIGHLAQATVGLSALGAALVHVLRNPNTVDPATKELVWTLFPPKVHVPREYAVIDFLSERLYTLDGKPPVNVWGPIGGLYQTANGGHVRVHDNFPHHSQGFLKLLGLPPTADRSAVQQETRRWQAVDLENEALSKGLCVYALRSYDQWELLEQSLMTSDMPVSIRKAGQAPKASLPRKLVANQGECLAGLRVIEMTRVIAGPVCGQTLAAHGADVIWITSPNLPALPALDINFGRGKRRMIYDLNVKEDREMVLNKLTKDCDVFLQSYRPGSLDKFGLSGEELIKAKPGIIIANLSAFGPKGPWAGRRGYDSLVQTCTGMNVSEAEHAADGTGIPAKPMPCQALDHAAGRLLAFGVCAALYKRSKEGGSWVVDVSLASVAKYLKSLGQYPTSAAFNTPTYRSQVDVPPELLDRHAALPTEIGAFKGIQYPAKVDGVTVYIGPYTPDEFLKPTEIAI